MRVLLYVLNIYVKDVYVYLAEKVSSECKKYCCFGKNILEKIKLNVF